MGLRSTGVALSDQIDATLAQEPYAPERFEGLKRNLVGL